MSRVMSGARWWRTTDPLPQADARQLSNLLPFRQVIGVKNVVHAMAGRFPEE